MIIEMTIGYTCKSTKNEHEEIIGKCSSCINWHILSPLSFKHQVFFKVAANMNWFLFEHGNIVWGCVGDDGSSLDSDIIVVVGIVADSLHGFRHNCILFSTINCSL